MNKLAHSQPAMNIAERGLIGPEDVRVLRREFYRDDRINLAEAEALLQLDVVVQHKCREWAEFFVEALVEFVVRQSEPVGHVSDEGARWLKDNISDGELIESAERLEMLVKVLQTATSSPEFLTTLALQQVSRAVLENQGPVAKDRAGDIHVICKSDVELIRHLIFGLGGQGGMEISKAEAEFLFDLNNATIENENDPAWSELFVKAVGSYLMATLDKPVPVAATLTEDEWLVGDSILDRLSNSLKSAFQAARSPTAVTGEAFRETNSILEERGKEAVVVTQDETEWVTRRINANGSLHANEKALLNFLNEESSDLPPDIKKLIDSAA